MRSENVIQESNYLAGIFEGRKKDNPKHMKCRANTWWVGVLHLNWDIVPPKSCLGDILQVAYQMW